MHRSQDPRLQFAWMSHLNISWWFIHDSQLFLEGLMENAGKYDAFPPSLSCMALPALAALIICIYLVKLSGVGFSLALSKFKLVA